jgi:6-phosphogluconolactonase
MEPIHMRFKKLILPLLLLLVSTLMLAAQDTPSANSPRGAVFALTNRTEKNEVIAFARTANGSLIETGHYSTRGDGIGSDFDSQGGLVLSPDHRFLYACNPGSDDITVFAVQGSSLVFLQKVPAGDEPLSITISGRLMYVLDGSVAATQITGFTIGEDGLPSPLPNSTKPLSSPIAVPGEVLFSPDGKMLVVTHKVGGVSGPELDTFLIDQNGLPGDPVVSPSSGMRPFAEAFRNDLHGSFGRVGWILDWSGKAERLNSL